jgi:hypothetical protein
MKNSKRLYLDVRSTQDKKTKANAGLGNYAIELRSWMQKLIDGGQITLANSPTSANITTGTVAAATGTRTIDFNYNQLSFNNISSNYLTATTLLDYRVISGLNIGYITTVPTYSQVKATDGTAIATIRATNTGLVHLHSTNGSYKIGSDSGTTPLTFSSNTIAPQTLSINNTTGDLFKTDTSALFVSNTQINPSSAGAPTRTEILTFITAQSASYQGAAKNRVIYYTGTDTATDAYTYAYYLTGDLKLFVIDKP